MIERQYFISYSKTVDGSEISEHWRVFTFKSWFKKPHKAVVRYLEVHEKGEVIIIIKSFNAV